MLLVVAALQLVVIDMTGKPFHFPISVRDFILNLALLNSTGLESGPTFNAVSWSISTEMVVNCIFLMIIALPRRFSIPALFALFVIAASVVFSGHLITNARPYGIDNDVFRTIFGFLIGTALWNLQRRMQMTAGLGFDMLFLLSVGAVMAYCELGEYGNTGDLWSTVVLFPAVIIAAQRGKVARTVLRTTPLVWLGTISYSIYLIHFTAEIIAYLIGIVSGKTLPYGSAFFFVAYLLSIIVAASITYLFIEIPGKNFAKRLFYRAFPFLRNNSSLPSSI
ncbi:acyltransferase family protein [Burkholderia multivorans]|uniref:acyltransferase family protein n=1 Tax=Burkholderia multivorans TaxID=87883 RepID=UPI0020198AF0|nr:acyltransferase [Burkholderia multivorans]MCO1384486.1 acyltransferase [Burkholderia multivorans]MCO1399876.1 acyltransferase [Burkholderia multivorans]UQO81065.1 acyltransferase [Burkholderia multivorans]